MENFLEKLNSLQLMTDLSIEEKATALIPQEANFQLPNIFLKSKINNKLENIFYQSKPLPDYSTSVDYAIDYLNEIIIEDVPDSNLEQEYDEKLLEQMVRMRFGTQKQ